MAGFKILPPIPGTASSNGEVVAFSPDGTYLAVGNSGSTAPFLRIYKRSGTSFTQLVPTTLPATQVRGLAFSSDGNYLFVGTQASPFIFVYERNGDTFTRFTETDAQPTQIVYDLAISSDGQYLAAVGATTGSNQLAIFKLTGGNRVALTPPTGLPAAGSNSCDFSPNGDYLAIGLRATPYVMVFKRNGDTFTRVANPSPAPAGWGMAVKFSRDGRFLAVGHIGAPIIAVYERNGDTFSRVAPLTASLAGTPAAVAFSPDGQYLLASSSTGAKGAQIYERSDTTFTPVELFDTPPTQVFDADFTSDGGFLALAQGTTPTAAAYIDDRHVGHIVFPTFGVSGEGDYIAPVDVYGVDAQIGFPSVAVVGSAGLSEPESLPELPIILEVAVIEVTPEEILTQTAIPGSPFLYGGIGFPTFSVAAQSGFNIRLSADLGFPGFAAGGRLRFPIEVEAALGFPTFKVGGEVDVPVIGIQGDILFPSFGVAVETDMPIWLAGGATLPAFRSDAKVFQTIEGRGDIGFRAITVAGEGAIPLGVFADVSFRGFKVAAELDHPRPPDTLASGNIGFPSFGVTVETYMPLWIQARSTFPSLAVAVETKMPLWIDARPGFTRMATGGLMFVPIMVTGGPSFPKFGVRAYAGPPNKMDANMQFPRFRMDALASQSLEIHAPLTFPRFGVRAIVNGLQEGGTGIRIVIDDPVLSIGKSVVFGYGKVFRIG